MFRKMAHTMAKQLGLKIKKTDIKNDDDLYRRYYDADSIEGRKFYNISAGGHLGFGGRFDHPYWTNMDLDRPWRGERTYDPSVDISHDLLSMKPFPIESDSAGLAHSRYSIEHLTDEAALFFFKEVLRILKSKGIFRVVAPNIDLDYRAYQRGDRSFFYWQGPHVSLEQAYLIHIASNRSIHHSDSGPVQLTDADFRTILDSMPFEAAMDTIVSKCSMEKQLKYRDNHINWWNEPKLDAMLRKAGFKIVYRSAAEQSSSPVMRNEVYFDNRFQKCMFYMEAMKT